MGGIQKNVAGVRIVFDLLVKIVDMLFLEILKVLINKQYVNIVTRPKSLKNISLLEGHAA